MTELSVLEYLKKILPQNCQREKDYENLLPMTIGISTNKYQQACSIFDFLIGNAEKRFPLWDTSKIERKLFYI